MARQTGILKFKGSLGGLSFYQHKHYGMLVRKSNPVSAEQMRTDPAFQRTMENSSEFGRTSKAAKLLRHGLLGFLKDIGTEFLDNRLMKHMLLIKDKDLINARGKRCPGQALAGKPALLGGFELHATQKLSGFLEQLPMVNTAAGNITWHTANFRNIPPNATHASLTAFRGRLDFREGTSEIITSEAVTIPLTAREDGLTMPIRQPATASGIEIWGIKVVFLQEISGTLYPLNTGAAQLLQSNEILHVCEDFTVESVHVNKHQLKNRPPKEKASFTSHQNIGRRIRLPAQTEQTG